MKKILQLTFILFALLFHVNVNAQSDDIRELEISKKESNANNGRSFVMPPKVTVNHATNIIWISNPSNTPYTVTIINPMGMGIYSTSVDKNKTIHLTELIQNATGIYIIRIENRRAIFSFSLML